MFHKAVWDKPHSCGKFFQQGLNILTIFSQGDHDNDEEITICEYVCDSLIDGDLCNTNFTTDRPDENGSRSIGGPLGLILGIFLSF